MSSFNSFILGGKLKINRIGYGAMRITGEGVWLDPPNPDDAIKLLRELPSLGVNFIDTADSYGPAVSEELICKALHPYTDTFVATKAGLIRTAPNTWKPLGNPAYLRQQCILSLRRLKVDALDLFQLHRIDRDIPLDEQVGVLSDLKNEGLVKHVGLSEVNVAQLKAAQKIVPIASVQNLYNLDQQQSQNVLDYCTANNIGFIPWYPLGSGSLTKSKDSIDVLAKKYGETAAQVSLAWLLHRSPVVIPIPGTTSISHLKDNVEAGTLRLTDSDITTLNGNALN